VRVCVCVCACACVCVYHIQIGSQCTQCPLHSTTFGEASTKFLDCVCNPSYSGKNAARCTECLANTFKPAKGNYDCHACPNNTETNSGSTDINDCVCSPGYFWLHPGMPCEKCPEYTWKNFPGSGTKCNACPQNSRSLAGSVTLQSCSCIDGHYGSDGQACAPCQEGTFKATGGSALCTTCVGAHTTSQPGAYYIEECFWCVRE